LNLSVNDKIENLNHSKDFLYIGRSRLVQFVSELKVLENNNLPNLVNKVEKSYERCWKAFFNEFVIINPEIENKEPFQTVLELSNTIYQLPCSICGKISVEFKLGYGRFDREESLVFSGITHSRSFMKKLSSTIFKILKAKNLKGAHEFMIKYHGYEGLDAYCPECDRIYCWEHYNAREEWDEGFYDCTMGTCPQGHQRLIDD